MNGPGTKTVMLIGLLLAGGCGNLSQRDQLLLDTAGIEPEVDYANLDQVLERSLSKDRRIRPSRLGEVAKELTAQLQLLAVTGPTVTPQLFANDLEQLTYWYNARAAWSIKLIEAAGFPKKLPRGGIAGRKFSLDGRLMTLSQIDEEIEALAGWKGVVAAPSAMMDRASLPEKAFTADQVRGMIDKRLNRFVDDGGRVVVDIPAMEVLIPPVLWQYRMKLTGKHNSDYRTEGANLLTALGPYVTGSARRKLQNAIGYEIVPAPPSRIPAVLGRG